LREAALVLFGKPLRKEGVLTVFLVSFAVVLVINSLTQYFLTNAVDWVQALGLAVVLAAAFAFLFSRHKQG